MNLKVIEKINLLTNNKLIIWLNIWALVIFLGLVLVGIYAMGEFEIFPKEEKTLLFILYMVLRVLLFCASFIVLLVLHELIHGLFFKVFKPESKVKFGFKNGMAYAASPGSIYPRIPFFIIIIMPFIIISALLSIISLFGIDSTFLYLLFACHTSGCVGDFYYCYLLTRKKGKIYIEDTEVGIDIYEETA